MRPGLLFAAGEAVYLAILFLPDARRHLTAYLLLFFAGSLLSLFAARSLSASPRRFVLLCATAFRLTLVFRTPDLSSDVHRYIWDGRVAASGASPYAFAPTDSPDSFSPAIRSRLDYVEYRSVYPPVAQAAFRAVAFLPGDGLFAMKAIFAAADVAIVALLFAIGGNAARFGAALYAFHPLPVTETAGQGHLDALGVALLLASVVYLARRRPLSSGIAFAAAVLVKYVPLAAAPALLRRGGLRFAATAITVTAALWVVASRGGVSPAAGLGPYATRWEFNSVLYPAAAAAVDATELPIRAKAAYEAWKAKREHRPWMQKVYPYFYTAFFARALLATLLAAILVAIALTVKDVELAVFASLGALLLASPTLHPWYLLWVLPFAAKRREPAFLYLCTGAPLSYGLLYPLAGWTPLAIRAAEYGPFAVLLGATLFKAAKHRAETHPLAPLAAGEREGSPSPQRAPGRDRRSRSGEASDRGLG